MQELRMNNTHRLQEKKKRVFEMTCYAFFLAAVMATHSSYAQQEFRGAEYHWIKLADSAAFPKSYNFQLINIGDTIWACHSQGMWYTVDGMHWHKSLLPNVIRNTAFLDYVYYKNALYGLGTFEGNIERYNMTTAIFRTTDLRRWDTLATESNLPKRFFYHPFVFKNKLWMIGGNNGTTVFADAWASTDAVHWEKTAERLPFGPREGQQFVILRDTLYMLSHDVWSSTDGIHWKRVAERITEGDIYGYTAVAFDDMIWLLGYNRSGRFSSEVLASSDGRKWEPQRAPWSPRGGIAACVHKGRIIITGGKYGGQDSSHPEFIYSNDVWALKRR